jgi:hypothetical protein
MLPGVLAFTLTLLMADVWLPQVIPTQSRQGQSLWLRTDSQHFEIHYLPALAPEVDRVIRSGERAYDHISGRLDFVFAKKVPLIRRKNRTLCVAEHHRLTQPVLAAQTCA